VINEAFGRDFYQNEPPAEMCSFVDERSLDDRRSVASRPDFRACGFRVLVAQLGFHGLPGDVSERGRGHLVGPLES
jgi:hypothetical protein